MKLVSVFCLFSDVPRKPFFQVKDTLVLIFPLPAALGRWVGFGPMEDPKGGPWGTQGGPTGSLGEPKWARRYPGRS